MPVPSEARAAILAWYDSRGRRLPFRGTGDPYAVLVSEAMAQQTQVVRAAEAWPRFMAAFPTVEALAAATPAAVLRAWRGLGYNRRATSLRRAAIAIVEEHGGAVPSDIAALEALPGVGSYTARAVATLAYGLPAGPVDTNVRRVLGRLLEGEPDVLGPRALQATADAAAAAGPRPGAWTHAVMDLGATICTPRDPRCGSCPAASWCRAAAAGLGRVRRVSTVAPARPSAGRFPSTTRWLRGRILDALRDAEDGAWTRIPAPLGAHDRSRVSAGLTSLVLDGLAERHPDDPGLARLPLA